MSEKIFDVQASIKAQEKYCKENGLPHFAPHNGRCWSCGKNIYKEYPNSYNPEITDGIDVERAATELVTGCPHCNRSYCD